MNRIRQNIPSVSLSVLWPVFMERAFRTIPYSGWSAFQPDHVKVCIAAHPRRPEFSSSRIAVYGRAFRRSQDRFPQPRREQAPSATPTGQRIMFRFFRDPHRSLSRS